MLQARRTVAVEEDEGDSKTSNDGKHTIIVAYGKHFEEWHIGNVWSVGGSKFLLPDAAGAATPSLDETETSLSKNISNNNPRQAMTLAMTAIDFLIDCGSES